MEHYTMQLDPFSESAQRSPEKRNTKSWVSVTLPGDIVCVKQTWPWTNSHLYVDGMSAVLSDRIAKQHYWWSNKLQHTFNILRYSKPSDGYFPGRKQDLLTGTMLP